jgi:hypothetical protein
MRHDRQAPLDDLRLLLNHGLFREGSPVLDVLGECLLDLVHRGDPDVVGVEGLHTRGNHLRKVILLVRQNRALHTWELIIRADEGVIWEDSHQPGDTFLGWVYNLERKFGV